MYSKTFWSLIASKISSLSQVALLSGARNHQQSTLSRDVYDRMTKLFLLQKPDLNSAYLLLANTYASVGEYQKARDVRLKHFGKKTISGVAWTEMNGKIDVRRLLSGG
jgi:hypothetical protein